MIPLLLARTFSPAPGTRIVSTSPLVVTGLVTTAPPPAMVTLICLDHAPLPGVCTATVRTAVPPGRPALGTTASKPDAAQYGLPVAAATSGRLSPTAPWARTVLPFKTCTSSIPAHPSAAVSTAQ